MIHIKNSINCQVLMTIKEAKDFVDVLNDLTEINNAKDNLSNSFTNQQLIQAENEAIKLDDVLSKKYRYINELIRIGNSMLAPFTQNNRSNKGPTVIEMLDQDYFGILCETAIKKGIIHKVEEYIDYVDQY